MADRAKLVDLRSAVVAYVIYHGPSADHHRQDCPEYENGGCTGCQIDHALHMALTAALADEGPAR